ncbi:MAG: hypothetical protein WBD11_02810, partial [Xanthobacteraceae bacterium]
DNELMRLAKRVDRLHGQNPDYGFFRRRSARNIKLRLAIEGQNERNRLAIVKRPGRIGNADDPRAIGILRDDNRKAAFKFGGGGAVGESTLVGRISGALPLSNANNAKWAAGKNSGVAGDATKDRKQHAQHLRHGNFPHVSPPAMLSQVVWRPITTKPLLRWT